jgi:CDP-diacylglycerol--glycerol-3-phosphate 3-phosphatidyltransferase
MSMNTPNQITIARLVISLVVFVLIPLRQFQWALAFFLLAATTDWLDGYLARKHGLITQLGRILDPFADKILISGTFILLAAEPGSRIAAWMAVIVVGRELLVTALRSFLERQGADFSAKMAGKLKMLFQCGAVALSLYVLGFVPPDSGDASPSLLWATSAVVWLAIVLTIYSGIGYILSAARLLRQSPSA